MEPWNVRSFIWGHFLISRIFLGSRLPADNGRGLVMIICETGKRARVFRKLIHMKTPSSTSTKQFILTWGFRFSAAWFISAIVFGIYALIFAWRPLETYQPQKNDTALFQDLILNNQEYGKHIDEHDRPYIVEISDSTGGAILLYGAEHTKDPNDSQLTDMEARWNQFKPSIALCESHLGILFPGLMDPVRTFAEPGFVHALAKKNRIPTYTWEPTIEIQVHHLLKHYTKEQVALRFILTPYFSNLRFGAPKYPDAMVESIREKRTQWPGMEQTFPNMQSLQDAWDRHFPSGPDWRKVSDQFELPGFLNEMDANIIRDRHFFAILLDLVGKGERIFAVAGSSHAVKLEPALKAALESIPPKGD